jgi:drug/metabolite transporter (DMT)-like permease
MKELQSLYNNINAFFSSTYAYVFCFIGLVLIALFIIFNRNEGEIRKKIFSWVACAILLSSVGGICYYLFGVSTTLNKYYFFDFDKAASATND